MNIFISATDSGVGKTVISAGLAAVMQSLGYKTGVYKPVQTSAEEKLGFLISSDIAFVKNIDPYIECICSYPLKSSCVPSIAAEKEGFKIETTVLLKHYKNLERKCDSVIIDGEGGLLVPLSDKVMMGDFIKMLSVPVLFVVDPQSTSINQVLLTLKYSKSIGLKNVGVIINKYPAYVNDVTIKTFPRLIEEYSDAKVLGIVPEFSNPVNISATDLITAVLNGVDIEKIFNLPIPKLNLGV